MAQQEPANQRVMLPGSILRWIHAAEPVFAEQKLKVENYTVVNERENTVIVSLISSPREEGFGSMGKYLDYEVTFDKKTRKILKAHYIR